MESINYLFTIVFDTTNLSSWYHLDKQYQVIAPDLDKAIDTLRDNIDENSRSYNLLYHIESVTRESKPESKYLTYKA